MDDEVHRLLESFSNLFSQFGISTSLVDCAFLQYKDISHNYDLQGDVRLWLTCAVYEQYKISCVGTLNIVHILKTARISFPDFLNKMKHWMEMAFSEPSFKSHILLMEQRFNVNMVLFKKYQLMFNDLFLQSDPDNDFGSDELFYLIWLLYVQIKASLNGLREDLVNCYQLLFCCVDLLYANVLHAKRRDLINPFFEGNVKEFNRSSTSGQANAVPFGPVVNASSRSLPSIMECLCLRYGGQSKDCLSVKQHFFIPHLVKLSQEGALTLNPVTLVSFFSHIDDYYSNRNFLDTNYELLIQKTGQLDERVFVIESKHPPHSSLLYSKQVNKNQQSVNELCGVTSQSRHQESSHLTGHKIPTHRPMTSYNVQGVLRLHTALIGFKNEPSSCLIELFNECSLSTLQQITNRIQDLSELFAAHYQTDFVPTISPQSHSEQLRSLIDTQLYYAQTLYFKLLEASVSHQLETSSKLSTSKVSVFKVLHRDELHRSLFGCCVEIVLFSCQSSSKLFPWVLSVFGVKPYHFYRVIEIVIRHEESLSRALIKHLNWIEESILEEYAWTSDSPLWNDIDEELNKTTGKDSGVPRCAQVVLPSQISNAHTSTNKNGMQIKFENITGDRLELLTSLGKTEATFESIYPSSLSTTAQISRVDSFSDSASFPTSVSDNISCPAVGDNDALGGGKPKKTGPLALFFRKVYLLASYRLQELLIKLNLMYESSNVTAASNCLLLPTKKTFRRSLDLRKIWAIVEKCLVSHTADLFLNRHLDQVLLCAVYLIGKTLKKSLTFESILRVYRLQPQSNSSTYRNVLLKQPHHQLQEQHDESYQPLLETEKRGDIIAFYNEVFLPICSQYVNQPNPSLTPVFLEANSNSEEVVEYKNDSCFKNKKPRIETYECTVPCYKDKPFSARKLSPKHTFHVLPLKEDVCNTRSSLSNNTNKSNILTYRLSISLSKDLTDMNAYIRSSEMQRKRNVPSPSSALHSSNEPNYCTEK